MRRIFPLIIRKNGEHSIPNFPVDLKAGDQFILVQELAGSQVPEGESWTIEGYTRYGPKVSEIRKE